MVNKTALTATEELDTLKAMEYMTIPSLSPDLSKKWEEVRTQLILNRSNLNIDWQFIEWVEKSTQEASLKGFDDLGNAYEATAIMNHDMTVEKVYNVELMDKAPVTGECYKIEGHICDCTGLCKEGY